MEGTDDEVVVLPQAARTTASRVPASSEPSGATGGVGPGGSLQPKVEDDNREGEYESHGDGDAVKIPLNHSRSLRRCTHTAAEHVGKPATFSAVHQDEKNEAEGRHHTKTM